MPTSATRRLGLVVSLLAFSSGAGPAAGQQTSPPSRQQEQTSSPSRLEDHKVLKGDFDIIWSLSFAADGQTLAAALEDGTVRVWDVVEGKEVAILRGHAGAVRAVAFSPDGTTLASASADRTVKLWSWAAEDRGKVLATLEGHKDFVISAAFSPDGKLLASGSFDGTVRLWDVADRKEKRQFDLGTMPAIRPPVPCRASAVAFSFNGRMLGAVTGADARLWDVKSGKLLVTLGAFTGMRGALPGVVGTFDAFGGGPVKHAQSISTAAFTAQGKYFVTQWKSNPGTDRAPLKLWDVATGQPRNLLQIRQVSFPVTPGSRITDTRGSDTVSTFALSPDGKLVATCGTDVALTGKEKTREEAYRVDAGRAGWDELVLKLWDANKGKLLARLAWRGGPPERRGPTRAVTFSPQSNLIATGGEDKVIRVWVVAKALQDKEK